MKSVRIVSTGLLALLFLISFTSSWQVPQAQFRQEANARPGKRFPMGTDALGRDRLARLIYGTRISLLLAPTAAFIAVCMALLIGGSAGFVGGLWDSLCTKLTELFLSLPWLFLFLTARAILPLNTAPAESLAITFGMMGLLAWAPAARVVRASVVQLRKSDFLLYARAGGYSEFRALRIHVLPHLRAILLAQFWIAIPGFILAEASLGLLGLGVAEPLPSWGNLLRELETVPAWTEWWVLAPVFLLGCVMICFQLALPRERRG